MIDLYGSWLKNGLTPMDDVARELLRAHLKECRACRQNRHYESLVRALLEYDARHPRAQAEAPVLRVAAARG